MANEDLVVVTACTPAPRECALLVGRHGHVLASTATGKSPPEVIRNGDARHLRVRYVEPRGLVDRAVTYQYGRVDLSEAKRP